MKTLGITLVLAFSIACATRYGYQETRPTAVNLSEVAQAMGIVEQDGNCFIAINLKSGRSIQAKLDSQICHDAKTYLAALKAAATEAAKVKAPQQ